MSRFPKTIYTFWHDPLNIPSLVQRCIQSWKETNPSWTIVMLDGTMTWKNVPPSFSTLRKQHQADWVRLQTIYEKGGLWLDASILLLNPVEHWIDTNLNGFQGYWFPSRRDTVDNWAFGASPHNPFVRAWFEEFDGAIRRGLHNFSSHFKDFCKDHRLKHFASQSGKLPYFTMAATSTIVLKTRPKADLGQMHLLTSKQYGEPLHRYLEIPFGIAWLPSARPSFLKSKHLLKLNRHQRQYLNALIKLGLYHRSSFAVNNLHYLPPNIPLTIKILMIVMFVVVTIIFICFLIRVTKTSQN